MNEKPVSYLQTDPRWKNLDYSAPGEKTTIGASGCGPTAMAMVLATWVDQKITPVTECEWALAHGFKAPRQGTYYGYFESAGVRHGLTVQRLNYTTLYGNSKSSCHTKAKAALDAGDLVIACMGKGNWTSSGHYVLVYGINGDVVYINDPASTKKTRTQGSYSLFKQQTKFYWVIKCPEKLKKEAEDVTKTEVNAIVTAAIAKIPAPAEETVYNTVAEVPEWGRATVQRLVNAGALEGTGIGLGLTHTMIRLLVINDRMGLYRG